MPLSWNDIRNNAYAFSRDWAAETREHAEAKSFWDEFFLVFGIKRRRVASFEHAVTKLNRNAAGGVVALAVGAFACLMHVQFSEVVQGLPSSQLVASLARCTRPCLALQLSALQALLSSQRLGPPGLQAPPTQESPAVQTSPSAQVFTVGRCTQLTPPAQPSLVQGLASSQALSAVQGVRHLGKP